VSTRSQSRPPVAAFVPTVGCYLASGNTVRVRPSNTCHQFQGRIISIDKMEQNIIFPAHPFISNQSLIENSNFCIEIQLFLPRDSNIFQRMNIVIPQWLPELAAVDIPEMLESNLVIWILPSQITNIVFFIHHSDCMKQVYGPVHGRANAFLVTHRASFSSDGSEVAVETLAMKEWQRFGPNSGHRSTVVSAFERHLLLVSNISEDVDSLLNKASMAASSITQQMGRDEWFWFLSALSPIVGKSIYLSQYCSHRTTLPDLSVGTPYYSVSYESVVIAGRESVDSLRRLVSLNLGIRVKTNNPTRAQYRGGQRVIPLERTNIICVIESLLDNLNENYTNETQTDVAFPLI
jgi:hypothetical protein